MAFVFILISATNWRWGRVIFLQFLLPLPLCTLQNIAYGLAFVKFHSPPDKNDPHPPTTSPVRPRLFCGFQNFHHLFYPPTSLLFMWWYCLFDLCLQKVTKLGQFRLKDESPSSASSLQPGSLFFNRDNATKSSPALKGKITAFWIKGCWSSVGFPAFVAKRKHSSAISKIFPEDLLMLPCFQASSD